MIVTNFNFFFLSLSYDKENLSVKVKSMSVEIMKKKQKMIFKLSYQDWFNVAYKKIVDPTDLYKKVFLQTQFRRRKVLFY